MYSACYKRRYGLSVVFGIHSSHLIWDKPITVVYSCDALDVPKNCLSILSNGVNLSFNFLTATSLIEPSTILKLTSWCFILRRGNPKLSATRSPTKLFWEPPSNKMRTSTRWPVDPIAIARTVLKSLSDEEMVESQQLTLEEVFIQKIVKCLPEHWWTLLPWCSLFQLRLM